MALRASFICFICALLLCVSDGARLSRQIEGQLIEFASNSVSEASNKNAEADGVKWALLVAGSAGYGNYRHQADICHAYQLLKKNGLKDENIVTFMYDDIAENPENPVPGTIINKPGGNDVYSGVPKDYTGRDVSVNNFLAALKGDTAAISGGSGKVVNSGPNDHVFVFYSDHGGPGVLGMPSLPYLFADDIVDALLSKHTAGGYKELVFYLEACESGSIFEGILPKDINVYATTASNAEESSWGTYCPGMLPEPPAEYETCLGDLYSVAWMEDSDIHNLNKETLKNQYEIVKDRTSNHHTYEAGSHVMQYGTITLDIEPVAGIIGSNPANDDVPLEVNSIQDLAKNWSRTNIHQRDAELLHLWTKYANAAEGSERKSQALDELTKLTARRSQIDTSLKLIGQLVFGEQVGQATLAAARGTGQPLVDDWTCLKQMVRTYESHCGLLTQYGMKHMRSFANLCNHGIQPSKLGIAARDACRGLNVPLAEAGLYSA